MRRRHETVVSPENLTPMAGSLQQAGISPTRFDRPNGAPRCLAEGQQMAVEIANFDFPDPTNPQMRRSWVAERGDSNP